MLIILYKDLAIVFNFSKGAVVIVVYIERMVPEGAGRKEIRLCRILTRRVLLHRRDS